MLGMAKKKTATLYVDIEARLKSRLDSLAKKRRRKLNAEVELALERYLAEEEPKEGLGDAAEDA
jgi:predicted transcriptional regulator